MAPGKDGENRVTTNRAVLRWRRGSPNRRSPGNSVISGTQACNELGAKVLTVSVDKLNHNGTAIEAGAYHGATFLLNLRCFDTLNPPLSRTICVAPKR